MSIVAKLAGTEEPHFSVHEFNAVMLGWLMDDFTSAQSISALESLFDHTLTAAEQTEMTDIRTHFDALSNDGKNHYWHRFEAYALLLQHGVMTESQYRTLMGIT